MRSPLRQTITKIMAKAIVNRSDASSMITKVRRERLTYLSISKFAQIVSVIDRVKRDKVPGQFIEAGCALGGSAIVIASIMPSDRILTVYDVFGMIPPPTEIDPPEVKRRYETISSGQAKGIDGDTYYGYICDLKQVVNQNLAKFLDSSVLDRVELVEGLLQETMQIQNIVAFAHIDVDWYEPVMVSLERIAPMLSIGGCIVLDDYFDWGGCREAVDEFLARNIGKYKSESRFGNMTLTRLV